MLPCIQIPADVKVKSAKVSQHETGYSITVTFTIKALKLKLVGNMSCGVAEDESNAGFDLVFAISCQGHFTFCIRDFLPYDINQIKHT